MEAGRKMSSKHYSLKDAVPNHKNDFLIWTLLEKKKYIATTLITASLKIFCQKLRLWDLKQLCVCVCGMMFTNNLPYNGCTQ